MFTVSEENTVKCLEGFSWKPHKSFSFAQIAHELWARAQRGCSCSLFFPQRILGNLGSTGYQSRARNPRSFGQRRGRRRNNPGGDGGIEWILLLCCQSYKVIVSFYRSEEDSAFEKHRSLIKVWSHLNFQSYPARQPSRNIWGNFLGLTSLHWAKTIQIAL